MRKLRRNSGASIAVILVVIVLISVLGTSLVSLTVDLSAVQPATLDAAKAFYAAESGLAVANVQQAATAGPVSFEGTTWETTKAGDTYTTTVSKGGQVLRVITSDITAPAGGQQGGPLDESGTANTATTGAFYDPNMGWVEGDDKKIIMKVINESAQALVVEAFSVSSTGSQPKLKELKFATAANGWNGSRVWKEGDGVDLPTGRIELDEGGPSDYTIPAGSYIIVEKLEFKGDVDPDESITVTFYFSDGSQSDITFKLLNDLNVPANPLDEAASGATAKNDGSLTDNPRPPGAGTVVADDEEIVLKLINESSVNLTIESFSLSCTTSQPKLKELELATPGNQWDDSKVWEYGSGKSLPTGTLTLDEGDPAEDYVIPANGYVIVNELDFTNDVNPGTFTLVVNFRGGQSSTVVFTIP